MAQIVRALGERRGVLGVRQRGQARTVPDAAVGDRRQLPTAYAAEHAPAGASSNGFQVAPQDPGEWWRHGDASPFAFSSAFQASHFAAGAVIGPLRSDLGRGGTEVQLSPVVRRFLPALRLVVPDQRRNGDVLSAQVDGFLRT